MAVPIDLDGDRAVPNEADVRQAYDQGPGLGRDRADSDRDRFAVKPIPANEVAQRHDAYSTFSADWKVKTTTEEVNKP
jgi:hypothetical protein